MLVSGPSLANRRATAVRSLLCPRVPVPSCLPTALRSPVSRILATFFGQPSYLLLRITPYPGYVPHDIPNDSVYSRPPISNFRLQNIEPVTQLWFTGSYANIIEQETQCLLGMTTSTSVSLADSESTVDDGSQTL